MKVNCRCPEPRPGHSRFDGIIQKFERSHGHPHPRDVLTPDALALLQAVAGHGSFAAAARELGLVPSAVTYRVRQVEDALDVLLFDRSSRQARLTAAGAELLREGQRLLQDIDAVANRVKRVATGWEVAAHCRGGQRCPLDRDGAGEAFFALQPTTRLRCATRRWPARWRR
jgi:molybdate transport repressor ModE-like protein